MPEYGERVRGVLLHAYSTRRAEIELSTCWTRHEVGCIHPELHVASVSDSATERGTARVSAGVAMQFLQTMQYASPACH